LGDLRAAERFGIATRIHPGNVHGHEPENLKRVFKQSLACLKTGKVEILFLVTRDSATPIESTLSAVQELHDEGLFEEFGVSNFSAWQVAEASEIAARRGWIRPSVYQGLYNAITRAVEPELFKCLGNYGIRFHAYDPLAGGAFSKSFGASYKSARHKTHHPVLSLFSPCMEYGETAGQRVLALAGNFVVARAAFDTAVALWPGAWIELRQWLGPRHVRIRLPPPPRFVALL
jgi:aryl-alcohol dehydrogenase-like predicted oxidoreductase